MDATPKNTPARTPKSRKDARPTLTLKGDEFGPEFRALINKAAQKVGSTQSAFVADTLTREAQRILKGLPESNPQDTPLPPAIMTHRLDAQEKAIADLADQVKRLTDIQQLGFWQRVRLLLAPTTMPSQHQEPSKVRDAA